MHICGFHWVQIKDTFDDCECAEHRCAVPTRIPLKIQSDNSALSINCVCSVACSLAVTLCARKMCRADRQTLE